MGGLAGCITKAKRLGLTEDDARSVKALQKTNLKHNIPIKKASIKAVEDVLQEAREERKDLDDEIKRVLEKQRKSRGTLSLKTKKEPVKQDQRETPKLRKGSNPEKIADDVLTIITERGGPWRLASITDALNLSREDLLDVQTAKQALIDAINGVPNTDVTEVGYNALRSAYIDEKEIGNIDGRAREVRKKTTAQRKAEGQPASGAGATRSRIFEVSRFASKVIDLAMARAREIDTRLDNEQNPDATSEKLFSILLHGAQVPAVINSQEAQDFFEITLDLTHDQYMDIAESITNYSEVVGSDMSLDEVADAMSTTDPGPMVSLDEMAEEELADYDQSVEAAEGYYFEELDRKKDLKFSRPIPTDPAELNKHQGKFDRVDKAIADVFMQQAELKEGEVIYDLGTGYVLIPDTTRVKQRAGRDYYLARRPWTLPELMAHLENVEEFTMRQLLAGQGQTWTMAGEGRVAKDPAILKRYMLKGPLRNLARAAKQTIESVATNLETVIRQFTGNEFQNIFDKPEIVAGRQKLFEQLAPSIESGNALFGTVNRLAAEHLHKTDPLRMLFKIIDKLNLNYTPVRILDPSNYMFNIPEGTQVGMWWNTVPLLGDNGKVLAEMGEVGMTQALFDSAKNPESRQSQTVFIETLAHEMIHAASANAIDVDMKFAADLDALRVSIIDKLQELTGQSVEQLQEIHYGLTDAHEFLSEALTNPEFQDMLNSMPARGKVKTKYNSIWNKFIRLLANTLGVPVRAHSALDQTLRLAPHLMKSEMQQQRYFDEGRFSADWWDNKTRPALAQGTALIEGGPMSRSLGQTLTENWDTLKDNGSKVREWILGISMWNQIEDNNAKYFEGGNAIDLRDIDVLNKYGMENNANPLRALKMLLDKRQLKSKEFEKKGLELNRHLIQLEAKHGEDMTMLGDLANESSYYRLYLDKDWESDENAHIRNSKTARTREDGKAKYDELKKQFNALDSEVRQAYTQLREYYEGIRDELTMQQIYSTFQAFDVSMDDTQARIDVGDLFQLRKNPEAIKDYEFGADIPKEKANAIAAAVTEYVRVMYKKGPYFPSMRFGDWAVSAKVDSTTNYNSEKEAQQAAKELRLTYPGSKTKVEARKDLPGTWAVTHSTYEFWRADSQKEIKRIRADLQSQGYKVSKHSKMLHTDSVQGLGISNILDDALSRLPAADTAAGQAVRNALIQAYIAQLPESSAQKRMMRRKGVRGASTDLRRSMAQYTEGAGWSYAKMRFNSDIHTALRAMQSMVKNADEFTAEEDENAGVIMSQVFSEVSKRVNMDVHTPNLAVEVASKYGFVNYLMNISYSIVNSTQPYVLTIPYLTGEYGSAMRAGKALKDAYGLIGGNTIEQIVKTRAGLAAFGEDGVNLEAAVLDGIASIEQKLQGSPHQQRYVRMLKLLDMEDILGATFSMELSETAKGRQSYQGVKKWMNQAIEFGRTMPHLIEVQNRLVTAIATANLELAKLEETQSPLLNDVAALTEHLTDKSRQAIKLTQFDYSQLNRPRYFNMNDALRVMTIYKIHPLGVYNLYINYIKQLKGENRKNAMKALAMLTATHGSLAGAAGAIFMEPFKLMMIALASVFGDEEDEWYHWMNNPEALMREWVYDVTGSQLASETFTFGLPRLLNVDMYNRIGLHRMLIQYSEGENAFDTTWRTAVDTLAGPIFGMHTQFESAAARLAAGDGIASALSFLAPKQLRDIYKGITSYTEGVTDFAGNKIIDADQYGWWDMTVQASGFSPSVVAETNFGRKLYRDRTKALTKRRKELIRRYKDLPARDRAKFYRENIKPYNKSLRPDVRRQYRITQPQLVQSVKSRREREARTYKGIAFRKDEFGLRKEFDYLNLEK